MEQEKKDSREILLALEEAYMAPEKENGAEKETHPEQETEMGREIESMRSEKRRIFRLKDGSEQAVFYPRPLPASEDERADGTQPPAQSCFAARFGGHEESNELFTVEAEGHCVTVLAKRGRQEKKGVGVPTPDTTRADTVTFREALSGADITYTVQDNGVKEAIVIPARARRYRYPFILQTGGLTVRCNTAEKRVAFYDGESGDEVFYIPAPFMSDAAGALSADVRYDVKELSGGNVQLTVVADSTWINAEERVFPVTVDPQIMVTAADCAATYSWTGGVMSHAESHTVGIETNGDGDCAAHRMYLHLTAPTLPRNVRIKKALLRLTQTAWTGTPQCAKLGLFRLTTPIAVGNFTPAMQENPLDYEAMRENASCTYTFDVTKLLDSGASSYDLVLLAMDEATLCNSSAEIVGAADAENGPRLEVTYESSYGTESAYRSHSHGIGRFGTGSIDLCRGNLTFDMQDYAWAGNRMPLTLRHLYQSALSDAAYTRNDSIQLPCADFSAMQIGAGWKLNLMQSMMPATFGYEGTMYTGYVYVDESGREIYFRESQKTSCCGEEQCYPLYESVEDGTVYDDVKRDLSFGDRTYHFDVNGRLIQIRDAYGNHMDITYSADRISAVTDGAGRRFTFAYVGNELSAVCAPDGSGILYSYTDGRLSGIQYADGTRAELTYANTKPSAVILKDASDAPVYKVEYTFQGDRVCAVTEYGVEAGAFVMGAKSEYSYSPASRRTAVQTTEAQDAGEGETSDRVLTTVYSFDLDGNVCGEYAYTADSENVGISSNGSGIHPYAEGAGVVSNINNLLENHSFEDNSSRGWLSCAGNCAAFHSAPICCDIRGYGHKMMRMTVIQDCTENGLYQETAVLPVGEYTFSVYVKTLLAAGGQDNPGVFLRVTDTQGQLLAQSENLPHVSDAFVRLCAPFRLETAQKVRVYVLTNGMTIADLDAAQLENNPYANAYNMLENGNFENGTKHWITDSGVSVTAAAHFNMSQSLVIAGDLNKYRRAYQRVDVKTERNARETFTLSGWAKGEGLPDRERECAERAAFRLRAAIRYYDPERGGVSTEEYTADFAPGTEEWQFATVQFAKSKYAEIKDFTVSCEYSHNVGHAYFDNIQLIRSNLETGLSPEDFSAGGTAYDQTADAAAEETPSAPAFEEKRDAYGNALTETTFTDGEFGTIYRSFGFNTGDDSGNNLIRETDARGNDTTYTVDSETSRNEEVTDRLGNKTAYTYDAAGRTTQVTSKKADGTEIANVSYAYDPFDNMSAITRGDGMKYVLAYNAFHNLESIGVDGKTEKLVTYTYKNGNGRLKQITYANGDTMKATYNAVGQMVAEKWYNAENVETARYKYVYDGQGNIVRSLDILQGKEYTYTYEDSRIVRAAESDITVDANDTVTAKTPVNSILYTYDAEGKLVRKQIHPVGGDSYTVYCENPENGNTVVKFTAGGRTVTSHSKSDSFGRKVFDELQLGTGFVSRQFSYHVGEVTEEHSENGKLKSSPTTQLVSQIALSDGRTISYEYDAEERITKITDSVDGVTEYTYDALGQLLTEKHKSVGADTYTVVNTMSYDNYGNILSKNGVTYTYGNSVWKDLLTKVGDQTISYDAQGNPTSYLGHTLTWEKGRQLKSFDSNTYTYNANGIRTSKTVGGVTHTYTLDGTKILKESWGENTLIPLRDNEDSVCGIIFNNEPYYFLKNLQGDIIAITDKDGTTVAKYSYDAWGVCTVVSDTTEIGIAGINPYRYRGYYFDAEIGMYYLQSRYYNPVVGRFVNADEPVLLYDAYTVLSYNLHSYCENIPVNGCDSNGKKLGNFFKSIVKTVVSIARTVVRAVIANPIAVNITQKGKFQSLFNLADFYRDRFGVYHTHANCWQKYFGYNDLYDLAFYLGTDMQRRKLNFSYNGKDWILWAWKGDYLNLGAGAELGIYNRLCIKGNKTSHWLAATKDAMEMQLNLTYNGNTIIDYKPSEKQWWITGFNPYYQDVKSNYLKATFKVKFNSDAMYKQFYNYNKRQSETKYDSSNRTVTIKF